MKNVLTALIMGMSAASCSTLDLGGADNNADVVAETKAEENASKTLESGEKILTPLADSQIPEGACGMVLWTLEGQRPVPVFKYVDGEGAYVSLSHAPIMMQRFDYAGAADFGVFEKQIFKSENDLTVEVDANFGLDFDGGAYLENGLIKLSDATGWSMVAPAAGIAGCR